MLHLKNSVAGDNAPSGQHRSKVPETLSSYEKSIAELEAKSGDKSTVDTARQLAFAKNGFKQLVKNSRGVMIEKDDSQVTFFIGLGCPSEDGKSPF